MWVNFILRVNSDLWEMQNELLISFEFNLNIYISLKTMYILNNLFHIFYFITFM